MQQPERKIKNQILGVKGLSDWNKNTLCPPEYHTVIQASWWVFCNSIILLVDLRNALLVMCMLICSSFLAPVFWHLWIYAGSANANFFFAITLAYSTAQVFIIIREHVSKRSSGNIFHPSNERRLVFARSAIGLANLRYPLSHNQMQIQSLWLLGHSRFSRTRMQILVL